MINPNQFKRQIKQWILDNPEATPAELEDYCESLIPTPQYQANKWLVEQTLYWYSHILSHRSDEYNDEELVA